MSETLKTLLDQKAAAAAEQAEIESAIKAERGNVIADIQRMVGDLDLTPADIFGAAYAKPAKKAAARVKAGRAPKYRDPVTGSTWAGVGKRPKWLQAAMNGGTKVLADFAIPA